LQLAAFVLPLAALTTIAVDLAQYFQGPPHCFAPIESRVASNLPFLIVSLAVAVLCFLFQQCVEARAQEQKRVIDDLATDLILSFLDNGKRSVPAPYQPGRWRHSNETDSNATAVPDGCPE
jgi:hypothetical protein